jgi:hypothetical protein
MQAKVNRLNALGRLDESHPVAGVEADRVGVQLGPKANPRAHRKPRREPGALDREIYARRLHSRISTH